MRKLLTTLALLFVATTLHAQNYAYGNVSIGGYISETRTVAAGGSTTANLLVTINGTGNVTTVALGPETFAQGVAATTQSAGQSVQVVIGGLVTCVADNTVTAGNLIGTGSGTAGRCRDLGTTVPFGVSSQNSIVGKAITGNTVGNTFTLELFPSAISGTSLSNPGAIGAGNPAAGTFTTVNGMTLTTSSGTFTLTNGKTFSVSNTMTLAGTDGSTYTFPAASATIPRVVFSGTKALATGAIASTACNIDTLAASGTLTTDNIIPNFNANVDAVTGYVPATTGGLRITVYPTADQINISVCNPTALSITPGAVTLNLRVIR